MVAPTALPTNPDTAPPSSPPGWFRELVRLTQQEIDRQVGGRLTLTTDWQYLPTDAEHPAVRLRLGLNGYGTEAVLRAADVADPTARRDAVWQALGDIAGIVSRGLVDEILFLNKEIQEQPPSEDE